jgi:hypothetical protein
VNARRIGSPAPVSEIRTMRVVPRELRPFGQEPFMIEQHPDIATADGAMNAFVVHPEEGGPFPVVLFYMDAPGKREELHDMARRTAAVG